MKDFVSVIVMSKQTDFTNCLYEIATIGDVSVITRTRINDNFVRCKKHNYIFIDIFGPCDLCQPKRVIYP